MLTLVDAPSAHANIVANGLPPCDLKGLVRPALDRDRCPRGYVARSDTFQEVVGNRVWVGPELLLDDAGIPARVKAIHARASLSDELASTIVGKRDVQGLVNIPHPMTEELERGELGLIVGRSP